MNLLTSLARAYDHLPDAPPYGFSTEKIGILIALDEAGSATAIDLRGGEKKRRPRMVMVPHAVKRTLGIEPNFLWDKTAYVLGLTAGESKRTALEHQLFKDRHIGWLGGTSDPGLLAFLRFLDRWTPSQTLKGWTEDLRDKNAMFVYEPDGPSGLWLHDRLAAREIWRKKAEAEATDAQMCLVNGGRAPAARLHPWIKGVWGAQASGATLVSFNLNAFTSYGHKQGDNAPVSEAAAFAYSTVLNRFLEKGSGHRIQIGDASTVFWAEASAEVAKEAEGLFAAMFGGGTIADGSVTTNTVETKLARIRSGEPLAAIAPELDTGVNFHVLGLAPNAARLSVRFHWEDDFGRLVANYQDHLSELRLDPAPGDGWQTLLRYLHELTVMGKREDVPPNLVGDWMRAILTGNAYPLTLLAITLIRLRGSVKVNAFSAGILKSVLMRNYKMEIPVALDPAAHNRGYVLGRLFAIYEEIQRAALGGDVNATIKEKFYGVASAAPQRIFAMLDRGSVSHLVKLRRKSPGWAVNLEKSLTSITELLEPREDPMPPSLTTAEQAMFGIGYYHQRSEAFRKRETQTDAVDTLE